MSPKDRNGARRHALVESLGRALPGRGYFGGIHANRLEVAVGEAIRGIYIQLAAQEPEYLNLRGISVSSGGKQIPLERLGARASMSSIRPHEAEKPSLGLFDRKSIHSAKELHPWWRVDFSEAIHIDLIALENRADALGYRSGSIQITVELSDGSHVLVYDGLGVDRLETTFSLIETLVGGKSSLEQLINSTPPEEVRAAIVAQLVAQLGEEGLAHCNRNELNLISALLPRKHAASVPADSMLLANILLAQRVRDSRTVTGIRSFAGLLPTRALLAQLESDLNSVAPGMRRPPLVISRHGVQEQSKLRQHREANLSHLAQVILIMQDLGYSCVLAYGTLLGSVREGGFLAHDDDIDVLFLAHSDTQAELPGELVNLGEKLRTHGLKFRTPNAYWNKHVISKDGRAIVDLFPAFDRGNDVLVHMQGMTIAAIPKPVVFPAKLGILEGQIFPTPAHPEEFLSLRYGDEWTVSDPYFEWYWPLDADQKKRP